MSIIYNNKDAYQKIMHYMTNVMCENNPDSKFSDVHKKILKEKSIYDIVYKDVINIAIIARSHGGRLFGGVVRSFLLRKEITSDIDIWFTNQKDYDNFVEQMKELWNLVDYYVYHHDHIYSTKEEQVEFRIKSHYPFSKERFVVTNEITGFIYNVDLVCNETLPVNCVTYDGKKLESFCGPLKSVLEDINLKIMRYIPNFDNDIDIYYKPRDYDCTNIKEEHYFHVGRVKKFIASEWRILSPNDSSYKSMGFITEKIINESISE